MNDPAPAPPKWDFALLRTHVFSIWGMVGLLVLTVAMMIPVIVDENRPVFLLFACAMLAHFTIQFLLTVAVDDVAHRRHPRKRRVHAMQWTLFAMSVPSIVSAYSP